MSTRNILSLLAVAVAVVFIPGRPSAKAAESGGKYELIGNVLAVTASVEQDQVQGRITSCTPNLLEYQVRDEPEGDWLPINPYFTLPLSRQRHEWLLRAVNLAGVAGPSSRVVVERK